MTNTLLTLLSYERLGDFYARGFWQSQTIYAFARTHAERAPEAYALRHAGGRLTYRELVDAADAFAADLTRRGLRPGDRLAVWLPSRAETAIALLACSRNGFVCCPSLHRDHTTANVVELLERMRATVLVTQPGYGADGGRSDARASLAGVPSLRHVYALDDTSLAAAAGANTSAPNGDPNRIVYLPFTSGTTGEPKGVMHTDNTLLANALRAERRLADRSGVGDLLAEPAQPQSRDRLDDHGVRRRRRIRRPRPAARARASSSGCVATKATFLVGVPTHAYRSARASCARTPRRKLDVKGFRISGAAASHEVVAGLLDFGIMPQSGYGMTEAGSHNYTLPDDDVALRAETSGKACRGYELRDLQAGRSRNRARRRARSVRSAAAVRA